MQHLTTEELARLVDAEEPDAHASLHLELCGECRAELERLGWQTRALGELPPLAAPPALWDGLEERLAAEGLIAASGAAPSRRAGLAPLLRVAAALALFLGGAATSAALRPAGVAPPLALESPSTASQAEEALRAAEAEYFAALSRYAELSGTEVGTDPVNRLAALEGIVLTARAALQESPADPVINGYLFTALGQRDAILRRISGASDEWY